MPLRLHSSEPFSASLASTLAVWQEKRNSNGSAMRLEGIIFCFMLDMFELDFDLFDVLLSQTIGR